MSVAIQYVWNVFIQDRLGKICKGRQQSRPVVLLQPHTLPLLVVVSPDHSLMNEVLPPAVSE